jgi:2-dehydropantoate 2-reductase
MRIVVFGTGGAGGYFGAQLTRAGVDAVFIARGDHLRAIRMHGLSLALQLHRATA